jgi:release factor glutamine methyltransferase
MNSQHDAEGVVVSYDGALRRATDTLTASGVPSPRVDAEFLLAHATGLGRGEVAAKAVTGAVLPAGVLEDYEASILRRASREPLQHITGIAAFRALELFVGPGVFVPRPETESVAQVAIDALRARPEARPIAVDLGTGSGAIALALATEVPHAEISAVELSAEAAVWTKRNIAAIAPRVRLEVGDLSTALGDLDGSVGVVVSNPPYIPVGMIPRDLEVRLFDPSLALYGGADGLDIVRDLSVRARALLVPGGTLVIEHGEQQGAAIRDLLTTDGWRAPATLPDLTGRDRTTTAIR